MSVTINASTSAGLIQTADTSGTVEIQSNGTTQFTVASTGAYGQLVRGTAQNTTSGTSFDFTGIPSWVKRITVMFNAISTNGSSIIIVQLGSGSVTTTGYTGGQVGVTGTSANSSATTTVGLSTGIMNAAGDIRNGMMIITNVSGNIWVSTSTIGSNTGDFWGSAGARITLSGTLDRLRLTTVNGTDAFNAGSVNILYEG